MLEISQKKKINLRIIQARDAQEKVPDFWNSLYKEAVQAVFTLLR